MLRTGRYNTLRIARNTPHGLVLTTDAGSDEVLLPRRLVPKPVPKVGEGLKVFVYRDSEDRLVATTQRPLATVGEVAYLRAVDVNDHGAFLDWGLDKDLFVPFSEQHQKMREGQHYVVVVLLDERSDRIMAASSLANYLDYYHDSRPHSSLHGNSPLGRTVEPPSRGPVIAVPHVGGLHHPYTRAA